MKGLRYSPLHVTEFCGETQGKFKVGLAQLINVLNVLKYIIYIQRFLMRCTILNSTVHGLANYLEKLFWNKFFHKS